LLEVKIFICLDNLWVDLSLPKMVSLLCASGFVCSCCQPFVKDVVLVGFTHLIPVQSAFKLTTRTVEHDNGLSFFFSVPASSSCNRFTKPSFRNKSLQITRHLYLLTTESILKKLPFCVNEDSALELETNNSATTNDEGIDLP